MTQLILFLILALFLFYVISRSVRIVRPHEKGVVERLGRYQRTLDSGLHFLVPIIDHLSKVDMRENVVDVPP
ncbi:MAG: SPFH domain-containing protein, partial [Coriobacteriia bacterium]|nr:SPFH domain-containing protein [Coriobacteriia bacterium]